MLSKYLLPGTGGKLTDLWFSSMECAVFCTPGLHKSLNWKVWIENIDVHVTYDRYRFNVFHALSILCYLMFLKIRICVCSELYHWFLCQCHLLLSLLMGISDVFLFEVRAQGFIILCSAVKMISPASCQHIDLCVLVVCRCALCCMCSWVYFSAKEELVNAPIENILTSHESDCNFKPLRESSCAALTGGR